MEEAGDTRSFNFVVASSYPLSPLRPVLDAEHAPFAVVSTMTLPGRTVTLVVVHLRSPRPGAEAIWKQQLHDLRELLLHTTSATLVVGDFNATWGNAGFRALLHGGWVDAAAAEGRPWLMTWSQLTFPLPPLVRLDHVLTNHLLRVTDLSTADGPGSDHRALVATVDVAG